MSLTDEVRNTILTATPHSVIDVLSKSKEYVRRRRAGHRLEPLVAELFPDARGHQVIVAFEEGAVLRILGNGGPQAILKVAFTPHEVDRLRQQAGALGELAAMDQLGNWRKLTASRTGEGSHVEADGWFTQTVLPGVAVATVDVPSPDITAACAAAITPLHEATGQLVDVDAALLERLIHGPINRIQTHRPEHAARLDAIGAQLAAALLTRTHLKQCRLHGDFGPTNVLWKDRSVTGIVDWTFPSEPLPPEVDLVRFAMALLARRSQIEFGDVVVGLLDESLEAGDSRSTLLAALDAGPNAFDQAMGVTLAWLHHVSSTMAKAEGLTRNPVWLLNNVDRVVEGL